MNALFEKVKWMTNTKFSSIAGQFLRRTQNEQLTQSEKFKKKQKYSPEKPGFEPYVEYWMDQKDKEDIILNIYLYYLYANNLCLIYIFRNRSN